ncbi:CocE/NonD family hydrolase [Aeromicrobium sp.]|uniref:CocE/NonD family hydrolase n=1 Tax=Aeromicrobium sp. TaxID=1871063 RepID=UPI0040341EE5
MTRRTTRRPLAVVAAALAATTAVALAGVPASAAAPSPASGAPAWSVAAAAGPAQATGPWSPRPEQYPTTTTERDVAIPMSDGTVLRGNLMRPVDAAGRVETRRLPVVVTITAYNKNVQDQAGGLGGGDGSYLVKRGYLQLTVDARGTGSSAGTWCAFCSREGKDFGEVMTWAAKQSWSNGSTAMRGPSYMGIAQMFAAADRPAGLKAIFPQVPAADVYRDVVASGGALDVGFIPLWIGLVNGTAIIPPYLSATDPAGGLGTLVTHLLGNGAFSLNLLVSALGGGEPAYDGAFYTQRSPIEVVSRITTPTFLLAGEYDLFQRGTPLLYENLQRRGVPTKMIVGPWDHLQASGGQGLEAAGYGSLGELQLRWFDHYVKKLPNQRLSDIAGLSYFEQGSGRWVRGTEWMPSSLTPRTFRLSGTARTAGSAGGLTTGTPTAGRTTVPAIPVQGLCSRSTNQWTAGVVGLVMPDLPCFTNNQFNDTLGPVFETAPLTSDVVVHGPLNARLYTSTPTGDGMLSVTVSDVAPDGTVSRLTGGWQVVSHRALDTTRSRYVRGTLVQPHHPFTKQAQKPLAAGTVAPVDVEVFPTRARLAKGHRLRVSVQGFDVPHLLPTLGSLLPSLAPMTVHTGPQHPSALTFGTP